MFPVHYLTILAYCTADLDTSNARMACISVSGDTIDTFEGVDINSVKDGLNRLCLSLSNLGPYELSNAFFESYLKRIARKIVDSITVSCRGGKGESDYMRELRSVVETLPKDFTRILGVEIKLSIIRKLITVADIGRYIEVGQLNKAGRSAILKGAGFKHLHKVVSVRKCKAHLTQVQLAREVLIDFICALPMSRFYDTSELATYCRGFSAHIARFKNPVEDFIDKKGDLKVEIESIICMGDLTNSLCLKIEEISGFCSDIQFIDESVDLLSELRRSMCCSRKDREWNKQVNSRKDQFNGCKPDSVNREAQNFIREYVHIMRSFVVNARYKRYVKQAHVKLKLDQLNQLFIRAKDVDFGFVYTRVFADSLLVLADFVRVCPRFVSILLRSYAHYLNVIHHTAMWEMHAERLDQGLEKLRGIIKAIGLKLGTNDAKIYRMLELGDN